MTTRVVAVTPQDLTAKVPGISVVVTIGYYDLVSPVPGTS